MNNWSIKQRILKVCPHQIISLYRLYRQLRYKPFPMNWTDEEREYGLANLYFKKTGKNLDWDNLSLFTEKLQYYKLFYSNPELSRIVDKVEFKKYIEERLGEGGHTIPLIGAWSSVDDIPWDDLPNTFVLKSNCSSDGRYIRIIKDKNTENFTDLKEEMKEWIRPQNTLIASYCHAYYDVTPMILAEKYEESIEGQLFDYKVFCFSGHIECLYAASEHFTVDDYVNDYVVSFYDVEWNQLNIKYENHPNRNVPRPQHLEEMVALAKELSGGFPFVRVDFFDTPDKLYLAEMTFYPGGGFNRYHPSDIDEKWGKLFILPPAKVLGRKYRLFKQ